MIYLNLESVKVLTKHAVLMVLDSRKSTLSIHELKTTPRQKKVFRRMPIDNQSR